MPNSFELPPQLTAQNKNARKSGRVRCQWTHCSLGVVEDISATGMRVICRRRPAAENGARLAAIVEGLDGEFDVSGRIVWKKKIGFFKWEMGIEFDEVTPEARKGLALLARSALTNDSLATRDRMRKSA